MFNPSAIVYADQVFISRGARYVPKRGQGQHEFVVSQLAQLSRNEVLTWLDFCIIIYADFSLPATPSTNCPKRNWQNRSMHTPRL